MPNWAASMEQTFEYYVVDPGTWKDTKKLEGVKSCTISRDIGADTLGSATISVIESIGECYIRVYLVTIQNGVRERFSLGTFLVQTPSSTFNGKVRDVTMDAYTPLLELKECPPPLGYSILKGENIMESAYMLTREHARAPIASVKCDTNLYSDFVADPSDTWLSFLSDLMRNAKYHYSLDEMGRILFSPEQETASLQPVWTYTDDNSSILYPELTMNHDIYGIPNVVEVVYSRGLDNYYAKAVNDDPNSPLSIQGRGRQIIHRITDPDLNGDPTEYQINEYAKRILSDMSTMEYTLTYTHGYCPVRLDDCVRFDYARSGMRDIKARVISQSIKCESGCPVTEKAVFTTKLWR